MGGYLAGNRFSQEVGAILEPSASVALCIDAQTAGAQGAPVDSKHNGTRAWHFKTWEVHNWLGLQYPGLTTDRDELKKPQEQLNSRMEEILEDLDDGI